MDSKRPHSEDGEQSRKRAAGEEGDSERSERESGEQPPPSPQFSGPPSVGEEFEIGTESDVRSPRSRESSGSQSVSERESESERESDGSSSPSHRSGVSHVTHLSSSSSSARSQRSPLSDSEHSASDRESIELSSGSDQSNGSKSGAYQPYSSWPTHLTSSSSSGQSSSGSTGSATALDKYDTDFLANKNYSIIKVVGSGAFGYVYRAENTQTKQIVAIKVLKTDTLGATVAIIDRLYETTQRLLQIQRHENIVENYACDRYFGFFVHRLYIVSEFAELPDLFDASTIKNALGNEIWWPLDEHQARHLMRGMARGVHHMHENGMSHSDLKTDNVLLFWSNKATAQQRSTSMSDVLTRDKHLTYELIPKLTDFDKCAQRRANDPEGKIMDTLPRSQVNYAAPESYSGVAYDLIKADCYSLGCCLMAMLLASHPFDDSIANQFPNDTTAPDYAEKFQLYKDSCNQMKTDVNYIRQLIQHMSQPLRRVLERLLDPNSETRITISQFLADQWLVESLEES